MDKKHLLAKEENDSFQYVKTEVVNNIEFEIYLDDYGQSYHLAWTNPATLTTETWCCGSYNDYHWDLEDVANYVSARFGGYISGNN